MAQSWDPSLPQGVVNPGGTGSESTDFSGSVPWTAAPETSHIYVFKYFDVRSFPALRKFPGNLGPGSLMYIQFIDRKTGKKSPTYKYLFRNPDEGQQVFDAMASSAHPYGDVFVVKIRNNPAIPYSRL
jgi:hypothetical protein